MEKSNFFKILHQNLNLNIRSVSMSWEWACRYIRQVEYALGGGAPTYEPNLTLFEHAFWRSTRGSSINV